MSNQPPYPPNDPNQQPPQQPGWGEQPPQQPGWGQQPPPNQPPPPPGGGPGWGQQPPPNQPPPPPGGPGWGQQPPHQPPPGPGNYSATDAIGYGWKVFMANAGPLVVVGLMVLLVPLLVQVLGDLAANGGTFASGGGSFEFELNFVGILFQVVGSILAMVLGAAALRFVFDVVDGQEASLGAMFTRVDYVQVLIAAVILGIASTIGLFLCIIPGLVILFFTWFTNYFIVARGQDAITAIKSSVTLVKDNVGALLLLALLCVLVTFVGVLACCIGLLVAYPVVIVANAYSFRVLQGEPVRPF